MMQFLQLLILSTAVLACAGLATLSREGETLSKDLTKGLDGLSSKCKDAFNKKISDAKTDDKLGQLCAVINASSTALEKPCSKGDYDDGKKMVCDKVAKWKVALSKRKFDIVVVKNKLSAKCKTQVNASPLVTWRDVDAMCDMASSKDSTTGYRQKCSGDECKKLADVACGAQALMAGLFTMILCLVFKWL